MRANLRLLNSITDADATCRDAVVVSGSHGGRLPAALASQHRVRALILNDAGIGLKQAGIAGILAAEQVGMAALAADHNSCLIGSAQNMIDRGRVSHANIHAVELGVETGMSIARAADLLQRAVSPHSQLEPVTEARRQLEMERVNVLLCDSASLVQQSDQQAIIITGSHGGLIGNQPERALKTQARLAAFNDAGGGLDNIGYSRLPALQQRRVAALTYSHQTAEIGDAHSALSGGVISACNLCAEQAGARVGQPLAELIAGLR